MNTAMPNIERLAKAQTSARALPAEPGPYIEPHTIDASDLEARVFEPPKFIVPGYITTGVSILGGAPKIGKSWLAAGVVDAIARGDPVLGSIGVDQRDCLLLALEDTERRLQGRMRALRQGAAAPMKGSLTIATGWKRFDEGGLEDINYWLHGRSNPRLIVVDTWQKVRPRPPRHDAGTYESDYHAVAGIKQLADAANVGVLLVHHRRKADDDDPLNTISGSTGLTGAVDNILVLKRDRADAVLFITGRDIEEAEVACQFAKETGLWTIIGPADDFRRSQEQTAIVRVLLDASGPMRPAEVARMLGKNASTVTNLMAKMVGQGVIVKVGTGKYEAKRHAV